MTECKEFQFGLVCLILAAFTGLAGFAIVYHYVNSERPLEQFAIVIDAGSTQTRSSLFMISVDVDKIIDGLTTNDNDKDKSFESIESKSAIELSKLVDVKQVGTCVNGGPVAQLQSEFNAKQLVNKCLLKFAHQIRKLDFINKENLSNEKFMNDLYSEEKSDESGSLDSDEISNKLALLNHRVNSLTHMHLGATAGMRALSLINETRADEKINWMYNAIESINEQNHPLGPYINKGFVNIISGSEEAAFGWTSVNFICDKLELINEFQQSTLNSDKTNTIRYNFVQNNNQESSFKLLKDNLEETESQKRKIKSIGTLELGGASSQIAYQVPNSWNENNIKNMSMQQKMIKLFNNEYNLATRSDLCLGMSQAILRVKFVLLKDNYKNNNNDNNNSTLINIINPCFQNESKTNLSSSDIIEILKAPCLVSNELDLIEKEKFISSINGKLKTYQFIGTGNTEECNLLLSKLLEPKLCKNYFSLCPQDNDIKEETNNYNFNRNITKQLPPSNMPFVTISGYNKALAVLNLDKKLELIEKNNKNNDYYYETIELIQDKLGGYSIDYLQFVNEYKKFCSININLLPKLYPNMHKAYYSVNCLQLVYINKLLTEFYLFDPLVNWKQLKFLLFPVKQKLSTKHEDKNDIGWSLGLLLNVTSEQFSNHDYLDSDSNDKDRNIIYHHGSSVLYVLRTTVFLMFACVLIAISLIVIAIFAATNRKKRRNAYIDHSHDLPNPINI